MTVSDYTIDYFIRKGITDVFCYPGSTLGFFLEALRKRQNEIAAHLNYHEQASSYAACAYSLVTGKPAVCMVMQGPGVTNAFSGIANAYLDSIPVVFITAQVHTSQFKGESKIRQMGVQELDTVSIVRPITKYAATVLNARDLPWELEKAWHIANSPRKGPVVLSIPVDISRTDIPSEAFDRAAQSKDINGDNERQTEKLAQDLITAINSAQKPLIVAGAGIRSSGMSDQFKAFIDKTKIPFVSSLLAHDLYPESPCFFGFIGSMGLDAPMEITNHADLIVSIGSRLSNRTIAEGNRTFAANARIIRIDIDPEEFSRKVKSDEQQIVANIQQLFPYIARKSGAVKDFSLWRDECAAVWREDKNDPPSKALAAVTDFMKTLPEDSIFVIGRGQAKALTVRALAGAKVRQRAIFTGGLGAMGFALPAAIGAFHAAVKPVYCFFGDGCMQMNIQELNYLAYHKLPVTVVILNNHKLLQIAQFQDRNFNSNYYLSTDESGYHAPDYEAIAKAYRIGYSRSLCPNSGAPEIIDLEMDW